ncbi:MAG: alpha-D-ribose 1-methylphosphonate 5-triphosphate diphosphatase, partial [Tardiphaga sp.]
MTDLLIEGGRTLIGEEIVETSMTIAGGCIAEMGSAGHGACGLDARGLLVMPGIVDIHGDAFERQLMPRPGVDFPVDVALIDSDKQAISNGITTVFHGTTWSWEPGLRGAENARGLLTAIETLRPHLAADTRFHLRQETFNLDAEDEIINWIKDGRIDLLAFNDHMDLTGIAKPAKRAKMVERTGLSADAFDRLVERVLSRADRVPASIRRLAEAANGAGVATLSHDDSSPAMRSGFRDLGVRIAEFPINEATASAAAEAGDFIVFGAPNVVRGGSHTGWTKASDMIAKGLCSVLASDYYYPAQLLAAFRLVQDGILALPQAWSLVS